MPSVFFASAPSKPGKPQLPAGSVMFEPSVAFTHGWPPVIAGSTYFGAEERLVARRSQPGSIVGQRVGLARSGCLSQSASRRWRSGSRCRRSPSAPSLRVGPCLVPLGRAGAEDPRHVAGRARRVVLELDVRRADAADVAARVRVRTHGAGVVLPPSLTMFGSVSFVAVDGVRPVLERRRERRRRRSPLK